MDFLFIIEPTPEERIFNVPGEVRVFVVEHEVRTMRVPRDPNRLTIDPEARRTVPVKDAGVTV